MPSTQTPEQETPETEAVQPEATAETETFDREKLEASLEGRLAAAFADEDETAEPEVEEPAEEPADDTPDDEPAEEPDDEPAEEEASVEDEDAEPAEEAAADEEEPYDGPSDAPTLPDAYRRSLKAYGWEDEDIDQNLRALGDNFVKTAERIHDNRNAEVQKWAEAGRQRREQEQPTEQPDAAAASPQQSQGQVPNKLAAVDVEKLKKEYGEDELVDAIAGPVNAAIDQINTILPQLQQGQQYAEQARLDKVAQEVESFFGDESLKPYAEVYGAPGQMNEQQEQARNKVLDVAYDLMLGSESLRGERLPIRDALDHAHHIVAKDHTAAATRKSLKKEAKTRNRGITQKPTAKSSAPAVRTRQSGPPETRDELEARTRERLAKAFQS